MIINKKMRDGSFIELKVEESQAAFLLKHDPSKYSIDTKKNPKEFKVDKVKGKIKSVGIQDSEESDIPDFEMETSDGII